MPKLKWSAKDIPTKARSIGGQRTLWTFEGVKGLALECMTDGERLWKLRYQVHVGGKRIERKYELGRMDPEARRALQGRDAGAVLTPGQARDEATAILARVNNGEDPWRQERDAKKNAPVGTTFDALFLRWIERHAKIKKKSWRADVGLYERHIKKRLGSQIAADLKKRDIIDVLDDIADKVIDTDGSKTGIQANRAQSLVSAVLNWATKEDLIDGNPAYGIAKRGSEKKRDRVMSDEEMMAFWGALSDTATDRILKLLLLLGQRAGETRKVTAEELRGDTWYIPGGLEGKTKNKRPHTVPLTPFARELIGSGFDFSGDTPTRRFKAIADGLKMHDIRLHDLRHCAATGMAACGVPPDIRQRVMNQVSGQGIAGRYDQHDYAEKMRRALTLWEGRLLAIVEDRPVPLSRW